ncbi:MAG: (2Fe-2S)-binding protein [Gammaproteobacteria bacterium]
MYINFWYPIVRSEDLAPDIPQKVRVLGCDLVAFRDQQGQARVLSDTCTHRGASLGGAWSNAGQPRIINGCIVCPYHGWEFGGDGECKNIPSIGYGTKPPARAKVDSYPTVEKYGIVFAFLGDLPESERPPLLQIEEYGQPGWRANQVLVLEVNYYYERSIENGLDPAHNEFVHPTHGHQGVNRETYRVNEYEVEDHRQGWGFWFMHKFDSPPLPQRGHVTAKDSDTPWGDAKTQRTRIFAGGGTYGPNIMPTYINLSEDKMFRQYFFEQPVDAHRTKIFFLNMRNFLLDPDNDAPIHARNKVIAGQDIALLLEVNPAMTPLSKSKEVLMPADKAIATYREWLRSFDDRGWRIDWKEFTRRHGLDKAYAIPSPGRRTSGNWVLDPVPLLKNRAERDLKDRDEAA